MFDIFSQHYDNGANSREMEKGRAQTLVSIKKIYGLHSPISILIRHVPADMAVKYFHLAEALYYRILESIIEREKMILGDADLSVSTKLHLAAQEVLDCTSA